MLRSRVLYEGCIDGATAYDTNMFCLLIVVFDAWYIYTLWSRLLLVVYTERRLTIMFWSLFRFFDARYIYIVHTERRLTNSFVCCFVCCLLFHSSLSRCGGSAQRKHVAARSRTGKGGDDQEDADAAGELMNPPTHTFFDRRMRFFFSFLFLYFNFDKRECNRDSFTWSFCLKRSRYICMIQLYDAIRSTPSANAHKLTTTKKKQEPSARVSSDIKVLLYYLVSRYERQQVRTCFVPGYHIYIERADGIMYFFFMFYCCWLIYSQFFFHVSCERWFFFHHRYCATFVTWSYNLSRRTARCICVAPK